jgi:hypothetical protein
LEFLFFLHLHARFFPSARRYCNPISGAPSHDTIDQVKTPGFQTDLRSIESYPKTFGVSFTFTPIGRRSPFALRSVSDHPNDKLTLILMAHSLASWSVWLNSGYLQFPARSLTNKHPIRSRLWSGELLNLRFSVIVSHEIHKPVLLSSLPTSGVDLRQIMTRDLNNDNPSGGCVERVNVESGLRHRSLH